MLFQDKNTTGATSTKFSNDLIKNINGLKNENNGEMTEP